MEIKKITEDEYRKIDAINSTFLKRFYTHSPAHAMTKIESSAFDEGKQIHQYLLEKKEFWNNYEQIPKFVPEWMLEKLDQKYIEKLEKFEDQYIFPEKKSMKPFLMLQENTEKNLLWNHEIEKLQAIEKNMIDKLDNLFLLDYWNNAQPEITILQEDMKILVDKLEEKNKIIFELKTCVDASQYFYEIKKYRYDMQLSYYQMIFDNFESYWIFVEKNPPFGCKIVKLSEMTYFENIKKIRIALEKIRNWRENGREWLLYKDGILEY